MDEGQEVVVVFLIGACLSFLASLPVLRLLIKDRQHRKELHIAFFVVTADFCTSCIFITSGIASLTKVFGNPGSIQDLSPSQSTLCYVLGAGGQFWLMTSTTWLFLISVRLLCTMLSVRVSHALVHVWGWGVPLLSTFLPFFFKSNYNVCRSRQCCLKDPDLVWYLYTIPIWIYIIFSACVLLFVLARFRAMNLSPKNSVRLRRFRILYVLLTLQFVVVWGIIVSFPHTSPYDTVGPWHTVYTVALSTQGVSNALVWLIAMSCPISRPVEEVEQTAYLVGSGGRKSADVEFSKVHSTDPS